MKLIFTFGCLILLSGTAFADLKWITMDPGRRSCEVTCRGFDSTLSGVGSGNYFVCAVWVDNKWRPGYNTSKFRCSSEIGGHGTGMNPQHAQCLCERRGQRDYNWKQTNTSRSCAKACATNNTFRRAVSSRSGIGICRASFSTNSTVTPGIVSKRPGYVWTTKCSVEFGNRGWPIGTYDCLCGK